MRKCFYLFGLAVVCVLFSSVNSFAQLPVITTNPANAVVCNGTTAKFFVVASNSPTSYLWQVSSDGGSTWSTIATSGAYTGINSDTLKVSSSLSLNLYSYRCAAVNGSGISVPSSDALLTVKPNPVVGAIAGPTSLCVGATISISDTTTGGTWANARPSVDSLYNIGIVLVHGKSAGIDTITYSKTLLGCKTTMKTIIHVDSFPVAGPINGSTSVCKGSTVTLSGHMSGGTWAVRHSSVDTIGATSGILYGASFTALGGTDTVVYTLTNSCGTNTTFLLDTVLPSYGIGAITGFFNICTGIADTLHDTATTGTWSNKHATIASIDANAGIVHGLAAGIDTITFTRILGVCTTSVSASITVNIPPVAGPIVGSTHVCVGAPTTLTGHMPGGIWRNKHSAIDSITSSGVLFGLALGRDTITYKLTNVCGVDSAKIFDTVYMFINPGTITGADSMCFSGGSSVTLTDATTGGIWGNHHSTIDTVSTMGTGIVYALHPGLDTITYSFTNICGVSSAKFPIRVDSFPVPYPIMGPSSVCVGSMITVTNTNVAGTHIWATSNSNLTPFPNGSMLGVNPGMDTIAYQFYNTCGSDTVYTTISIEAPLVVGIITGSSAVCVGSQINLSVSSTGGNWTSSNPSLATIDAAGLVSGIEAGSVVVSYTVWNSCGSSSALQTIQIDRTVSSITGFDSVGIGYIRNLSDSVAGGTWSSLNTSKATVDTLGNVRGVGVGIDTIVYTVNNSCGTSSAHFVMNVGNPPAIGPIVGSDSICVGKTTTYTNSKSGGVWSVKNTRAAITSGGVLTGLTATGFDTIHYTITNGFGTHDTTKRVFVRTVPYVAVHYYNPIAIGGTYPLFDTPSYGVWWSSNPSSISFTVGDMIVLSPANDTLVYTVTTPCGVVRDTLFYNMLAAGIKTTTEFETMITVFPNPSQGTFNLNLHSQIEENANIIITNVVGQKVKEFIVPANKTTEFTLDQPIGVYFLSASTASSRYETKIMIAK